MLTGKKAKEVSKWRIDVLQHGHRKDADQNVLDAVCEMEDESYRFYNINGDYCKINADLYMDKVNKLVKRNKSIKNRKPYEFKYI